MAVLLHGKGVLRDHKSAEHVLMIGYPRVL